MSRLPLSPPLSRALIDAQRLNVVEECATIIALLSSDNVFLRPAQKADREQADYVRHELAKAAEGVYGVGK